jgi:hypothetical protein
MQDMAGALLRVCRCLASGLMHCSCTGLRNCSALLNSKEHCRMAQQQTITNFAYWPECSPAAASAAAVHYK